MLLLYIGWIVKKNHNDDLILIVCGMVFIANKYIFSKIQLWQVIFFNNLVPLPFYTKYFQNRISVYIEMPHLQPLVGFLADSPFNPTHTPLAPRWTAWLRKALFAHTVIMKLANSIVHQKCLVENESWIFENFFIQIYSKLAFK